MVPKAGNARPQLWRGLMSSAVILRTVSSIRELLGVSGAARSARYSRSGDLFAPKPPRRKVGAVAQGFQLRPYDRCRDPLAPSECAEAAVGRRDDALAIADGRDRLLDAARDHFRMLDEIRCRLDHAGNQDLVLGEWVLFERRV